MAKVTPAQETDLYQPVYDWLVAQGFSVRSEVLDCDIVASRDDDLVVVELKRSLSMSLLVQVVDRLQLTDSVYVALPRPSARERRTRWRGYQKVLRRLEVGLIFVSPTDKGRPPEIVFHPATRESRRSAKRRRALLRELNGRSGEYNIGGSSRRKLMTAYREKALFLAAKLSELGTASPKALNELGGGPKTQSILAANHYGWFERVERGIYRLTPQGQAALHEYEDIVRELQAAYAANSQDGSSSIG